MSCDVDFSLSILACNMFLKTFAGMLIFLAGQMTNFNNWPSEHSPIYASIFIFILMQLEIQNVG